MPRDIKPLSKAKQEKALAAARDHAELGAVLKGRGRAVFAEPNLPGRGKDAGDDRAIVGIYDYDRDRSIVALVDTNEGEVLGFEETPAQFQLNKEERSEAEALARKDERVRSFLSRRSMDPLTRLYFPPAGSSLDTAHRYAIVFLRPSNAERRYAVVDLSAGEVVDVLDSLVARRPA